MALRRLTTTIKKLKNQPEILKQYDGVIREQLHSGVVEMVPQDQIPSPGDVHYLPHRTVVRLERDTTKVRVIYDASSKVFGPSLNDCLNIGPSLNPLLFDILLRFRVHEVALTADIEKAFLNIEIDPEYRDFVRFLWVEDPNKEKSRSHGTTFCTCGVWCKLKSFHSKCHNQTPFEHMFASGQCTCKRAVEVLIC